MGGEKRIDWKKKSKKSERRGGMPTRKGGKSLVRRCEIATTRIFGATLETRLARGKKKKRNQKGNDRRRKGPRGSGYICRFSRPKPQMGWNSKPINVIRKEKTEQERERGETVG